MAPSALPQQTESLTAAAVESQIEKTAPFHPSSSTLAPLDASKLVFAQNKSPQEVPGPNSGAAATTSQCTDHMITAVWYAL